MTSQATPETNIVDTLQSLTIAFALAMAVRSFVTEGFVIPTGSMAPTLLGAHIDWKSPQTGYRTSIDPRALFSQQRGNQPPPNAAYRLYDPMLSTTHELMLRSRTDLVEAISMGDRVLVLKFLYAFFEPKRWDVVVFKNPPDPVGDTQNYIKRLVGLPNEQLLLVDGDVWTAPLGASLTNFHIARKPVYVQRAVWQPVHDSDYVPIEPQTIAQMSRGALRYAGPPWHGEGWDLSGRAYRHDGVSPARLTWDYPALPINDYAPYNMLSYPSYCYPVSDLRVATAIEADDPSALSMELELDARSHLFVWLIKDGKATVSMRHKEVASIVNSQTVNLTLPPRGRACDIECWHVDQHIGLWLNGTEVVGFDYDDWAPVDRIRFSRFGSTLDQYRRDPANSQSITPPQLHWTFAGSPVTLHRVRVDRDIYYRPAPLSPEDQLANNGAFITGNGFGIDIDQPAQLRADQFLMLGDNSSQSRDGRLWGRPSPIVTEQLGEDSPFVVPRDLLLGKAWCVYFPSPLPAPNARDNRGWKVVPPFGSVRFIR